MKNKTPLTLDEKFELIKSGERFTVEDWYNNPHNFDSNYNLIDMTGVAHNEQIIDLFHCHVHKYEEPQEEWVELPPDTNLDSAKHSYREVKKSWIIEKAKEFGMTEIPEFLKPIGDKEND